MYRSRLIYLTICFCFALVGCQQNDWETLNNQVSACTGKQTTTCQHLRNQLKTLQALSLNLKTSPQSFGLATLRLQEDIAFLKQSLETMGEQPSILSERQAKLSELKQLEEMNQHYMTVIKWFEAP